MAEKLGNRLARLLAPLAIAGLMAAVLVTACRSTDRSVANGADGAAGQFDQANPLGANAACYVCHMTFVSEELSKTHLKAKVTCVKCHGVSAGHANDEDIGATKPDVTFERGQVERMCLECHKRHEVADAEAELICTDCHGKHRIRQAVLEKE